MLQLFTWGDSCVVWAGGTQENTAALMAGRVRHQEWRLKSQSRRNSHLCANPPKSSADLCREDAKGPTRKNWGGGDCYPRGRDGAGAEFSWASGRLGWRWTLVTWRPQNPESLHTNQHTDQQQVCAGETGDGRPVQWRALRRSLPGGRQWQRANFNLCKEFKKNAVITNKQEVSAEKWKWFFEKNQTEILGLKNVIDYVLGHKTSLKYFQCEILEYILWSQWS